MTTLFTPLTIRKITLRNRIMVSPMCQYSSEDGFANDWHLVHLGSRAVGGAALVMTEATAVSPEGRISPQDLGIWKDEHIERLRGITSFIHQQGAVAGIQLAHAGRKASHLRPWEGGGQLPSSGGGWKTVAPSALAFREEEEAPLALSAADIRQVTADFGAAAARALTAGFKVIELHAAHGYLIHQFLSPLSNQRDDAYGGSLENRIRFLVEITEAVRTVWPEDLPLFVRISATDWKENGWDVESSVQLARILKTKGVDLIDCSSGGLVPNAHITTGPGYQVPFAERIRRETGILTGAVGQITGVQQADGILSNERADLVVMARELLRAPYFPLHAAHELETDIPWPVQYQRAKPR